MWYYLASAAIAVAEALLFSVIESALQFQAEMEKYNKQAFQNELDLKEFERNARNSCNVAAYEKKVDDLQKIRSQLSANGFNMTGGGSGYLSPAERAQMLGNYLNEADKIDDSIKAAKAQLALANQASNSKIAAFRAQQALKTIKPQFSKIWKTKGKIGAAISGILTALAALAAFNSGLKNTKPENKCSSQNASPQTLNFIEETINNEIN